MRWPIRYQILLPFATALVLALVCVSLFSALLAARRAEQQIDEQLRDLGRTILQARFPLTDAVLEQMHGLTGAEFVLADDSSRVLARSSQAPAWATVEAVERWQKLRLGRLMQTDAKGYFVSALKIRAPAFGSRPQVLEIFYPEQNWRASRREAVLPPLAVGGLTLAIFMVVAAVIAARLGRPIGSFRAQVANLAAGNFQTLPLPKRDDELRDLAQDINSLAEQLAETRRAIVRAERLALLGQLSGGLAHHLRNDITGARLAVQLHQRRGCQVDEESLAVALRQLQLTEEHLRHFLSAGQPRPPQFGPCDPAAIVEDVRRFIEPGCRHRRVRLISADLRTAAADRDGFEADAEQIRQLLINLAFNAIEAAGAGGWIRLDISETQHDVRVQVLDSGPGVDAAIEARLFEPFATTKPEGIGLGLAAARQIAQAHGGTVTYCRQGEGTCFELSLPRRHRALPTQVMAESHSTSAMAPP